MGIFLGWVFDRLDSQLCYMGENMTNEPAVSATEKYWQEKWARSQRSFVIVCWAFFFLLLGFSAELGMVYKLSAERITHETYAWVLNEWDVDLSKPGIPFRWPPIPLDPPRAVNVPGRIAGPGVNREDNEWDFSVWTPKTTVTTTCEINNVTVLCR